MPNVVCLLGPIKSGKTQTLLYAAAAASHQHKVLIVSFDESAEWVMERLRTLNIKEENIRVFTTDTLEIVGDDRMMALFKVANALSSFNDDPVGSLFLDSGPIGLSYSDCEKVAKANDINVYYTHNIARDSLTGRARASRGRK